MEPFVSNNITLVDEIFTIRDLPWPKAKQKLNKVIIPALNVASALKLEKQDLSDKLKLIYSKNLSLKKFFKNTKPDPTCWNLLIDYLPSRRILSLIKTYPETFIVSRRVDLISSLNALELDVFKQIPFDAWNISKDLWISILISVNINKRAVIASKVPLIANIDTYLRTLDITKLSYLDVAQLYDLGHISKDRIQEYVLYLYNSLNINTFIDQIKYINSKSSIINLVIDGKLPASILVNLNFYYSNLSNADLLALCKYPELWEKLSEEYASFLVLLDYRKKNKLIHAKDIKLAKLDCSLTSYRTLFKELLELDGWEQYALNWINEINNRLTVYDKNGFLPLDLKLLTLPGITLEMVLGAIYGNRLNLNKDFMYGISKIYDVNDILEKLGQKCNLVEKFLELNMKFDIKYLPLPQYISKGLLVAWFKINKPEKEEELILGIFHMAYAGYEVSAVLTEFGLERYSKHVTFLRNQRQLG